MIKQLGLQQINEVTGGNLCICVHTTDGKITGQASPLAAIDCFVKCCGPRQQGSNFDGYIVRPLRAYRRPHPQKPASNSEVISCNNGHRTADITTQSQISLAYTNIC